MPHTKLEQEIAEIMINWKIYIAKVKISKRNFDKKLKELNGKIINKTKYFNTHSKMKVSCNKNHIFSCYPYKVLLENEWCKECENRI